MVPQERVCQDLTAQRRRRVLSHQHLDARFDEIARATSRPQDVLGTHCCLQPGETSAPFGDRAWCEDLRLCSPATEPSPSAVASARSRSTVAGAMASFVWQPHGHRAPSVGSERLLLEGALPREVDARSPGSCPREVARRFRSFRKWPRTRAVRRFGWRAQRWPCDTQRRRGRRCAGRACFPSSKTASELDFRYDLCLFTHPACR